MKLVFLFFLCVWQALPSFQAELNLNTFGGLTSTGQCTSDQYRCRSGKCIPKTYLCDGDRDCPAGEDERNCQKPGSPTTSRPRTTAGTEDDEECTVNEFDCGPGGAGRYGRCIPKSPTFICDGANDCKNGADERNCARSTTPAADQPSKCKVGEFQCTSGRCLRPNWVCDGDQDCSDGGDEANCRGATTLRRTSTVRRTTAQSRTRGTAVTMQPLHINGLKLVTQRSNQQWSKDATSKEACADLCKARSKCKVVMYDKVRKICTAFGEDIEARFAYDENFSSYGQFIESATKFPGTTFAGTDITYDGQPVADYLKITWSEQTCIQICHVHPKCTLAVWNTKLSKCILKTHAPQVTPINDPNYVSILLGDDYEMNSPRH